MWNIVRYTMIILSIIAITGCQKEASNKNPSIDYRNFTIPIDQTIATSIGEAEYIDIYPNLEFQVSPDGNFVEFTYNKREVIVLPIDDFAIARHAKVVTIEKDFLLVEMTHEDVLRYSSSFHEPGVRIVPNNEI